MLRFLSPRACVAAATIVVLAAAWVIPVGSARTDPDRQYGVWVILHEDAARSMLPPAVAPEALMTRRVLDTDRPINPAVIAELRAAGADIRHASRWLRAVSVDADAATLRRIAALPAVRALLPIRDAAPAGIPSALPPDLHALGPGAPFDSAHFGATWRPLRALNMPVLHQLGFTGEGMRIAILDTGFLLLHEALVTREVARQRDFINNDDVVSNQAGEQLEPNPERHGTWVWSLLGGYAPGRLVGGAPDATFYLAKVDIAGTDTRGDEDRWVQALEWADSLGVRIVNSSVGFRDNFVDRPPIAYGDLDGNTTITTRAADEAARRGILIVVAIGNDGPQPGTLWAPADADSVIAVGSVDSLTATRVLIPTPLSSRGPSADGRTKPDLVAIGSNLTAASAIVGPNAYEAGITGSSFATPFITAAAALFMQAWGPNVSIIAVRDALRLASTNADTPNNAVGWGMPDVAAAVMFPQGIVLGRNSLLPTDAQGRLTSIAPRFSWSVPQVHPDMRPIVYRLEIARDSQFTQMVFSDTITESFVYDARAPMRPMEAGWWRVVGESPLGVRRASTPQRFSVPEWVRLLTLNESRTMFINETRPELSWAPLSAGRFGRFTYDVQVLTPAGAVVQNIRNVTQSSVRVPELLTPNASYRWRVIARTDMGVSDTVESMSPFVIVSTEAPPTTILYQNFPNPFRDAGNGEVTRIWFDLARASPVDLAVYDSRGRLVRQLIPATPSCGPLILPPRLYGREEDIPGVDPACALVSWDGRDHRGDRVPRGIYMLRLRADGKQDVKHMLYLPPDS